MLPRRPPPAWPANPCRARSSKSPGWRRPRTSRPTTPMCKCGSRPGPFRLVPAASRRAGRGGQGTDGHQPPSPLVGNGRGEGSEQRHIQRLLRDQAAGAGRASGPPPSGSRRWNTSSRHAICAPCCRCPRCASPPTWPSSCGPRPVAITWPGPSSWPLPIRNSVIPAACKSWPTDSPRRPGKSGVGRWNCPIDFWRRFWGIRRPTG